MFRVRLQLPDAERGALPDRLDGRFAREPGYVATGLALPRLEPAATTRRNR